LHCLLNCGLEKLIVVKRIFNLENFYGVFLTLIFISASYLSCTKDITGERNQNIPPETSVFIEGDSLNLTQSIQTIYWDGSDADGFVIGYFYTFKDNPVPSDWTWTTSKSGTFPLSITGTDTSYRFQIKAVDNDSLEDPTPAVQVFPIKNTAPVIGWSVNSRIPDTTFTIAVFNWDASDLDGDTTIAFFEYALDDTISWKRTPGFRRTIILNADSGLTAGDHSFYIKAVDVAGAESPTIRMPELSGEFWYVKEPQGNYLLIDDFQIESSSTQFPDRFYRSILDSILPELGEEYSYWNIEELFPQSLVQFSETMKLFDRVIWYTDLIQESDPHFLRAQVSIPQFLNPNPNQLYKGGKLIYTVQFNTGFGEQGDPLAFSPVSSLGNSFRINNNSLYDVHPDFGANFPNIPPIPNQLKVTKFIVGLLDLIPKATSVPMYYYDDPNLSEDPLFILIGQNDNKGSADRYDFVFSGTPLNQLDGNSNIDELFRIILRDIF